MLVGGVSLHSNITEHSCCPTDTGLARVKSRNICTVKTAKWASSIAFVFFFLLNFFWFFVVKVLKGGRGARNVACVLEDFFVKFFLNWERIDGVLYPFGPFAIMAFTNIAIIYKFIQSKLTNRRCGRTESTNHALDNAAMRGTAILITGTMTFILLTAPTQIFFAISLNIHPLIERFLYISMAFNHSINGFLYCIVGSKFRKELIATLHCKRTHVLGNDSGISNST